jgi:hypothetical protein
MPPSFYLGPRKPKLELTSWEEVVIAAAAGVLDETQWVELKEKVPPASKPANLELARDLASLSLDGGLLVIGIADASGAAGEVVGTDLSGIETRVAQVASGRIAPPLSVTFDVFPKPDDAETGVLVVTVPASEAAPHMVDEKYWGRGAHGKRTLSDNEVRRLMADRQERAAGLIDRLRELPARLDPVDLDSGDGTDLGRLYVLVEPAAAAREPLTNLLGDKHMLELVIDGLGFRPQWTPSFELLNHMWPHPDGLAAASLTAEGKAGAGPGYLFILLGDDGGIQVSAPAARPLRREPDAPLVIFPGHLLEVVHGAIALAGHFAKQYTGYEGPWRVGLLGTRLRGLTASQAHTDFGYQRYSQFPSQEYLEIADTNTTEMAAHTPQVVARLTKRLLRGLSVERRFLPYENPRDFTSRSR